jgi:Helix-turn-helix of DDE superfamily endonuclease
VQVISVEQPAWIPLFTGLSGRQFGKLVGIVRRRGAEHTGAGRRWGLSLADRVLLVAVYYRTNRTLRQIALLFGISKSAAGRVVDHLGPYLA